MHKTRSEARQLASDLVADLSDCSHKLMIAPPFTALDAVSDVIKDSPILLGAQNMCSEESGAHTGEISADMLLDIGVEVVILGHSERRHSYFESDSLINKKVLFALEKGLEVILCVGETIDEREAGRVEEVVGSQLKKGLAGVKDLTAVTIAYEPVWAIGTGKTATPEDADTVHGFIRNVIGELYSSETGDTIVIQYGGSVKPKNASELLQMKHIDGALVGGASLKAETFTPIAKFDTQ